MILINQDVDLNILLLLDDVDLENVEYIKLAAFDKYLWQRKILMSHPTIPLSNLTLKELKALYYKLKYNKLTDIIIYLDYHHHTLLNWFVSKKFYKRYYNKVILKYLNIISELWKKYNKIIVVKQLYTFIYNHHVYLSRTASKYKNTVITKLKEYSNEPELSDLFQLYLQFIEERAVPGK